MARQDRITLILASVALIAACALAWVLADQFLPDGSRTNGPARTSTAPDTGMIARFTMWPGRRTGQTQLEITTGELIERFIGAETPSNDTIEPKLEVHPGGGCSRNARPIPLGLQSKYARLVGC